MYSSTFSRWNPSHQKCHREVLQEKARSWQQITTRTTTTITTLVFRQPLQPRVLPQNRVVVVVLEWPNRPQVGPCHPQCNSPSQGTDISQRC